MKKIRLCILDPGHFHAALLQKNMYDNVDATVHVYAPEGQDLRDYLAKIDQYNARADQPTRWVTALYTGDDFLARCLADKAAGSAGDVAVVAGNNLRKTEYLHALVKAGFHVLGDKPMVIDRAGFELLRQAFALAAQNRVLLWDIMTERFEITTMLQKAFSQQAVLFGKLEKGDAANPAVTKESVHHFSKVVSGSPVRRPAWFFDCDQQGEGLVDITTHLVDLVQWECLPGEVLDWQRDVEVTSARRWPTVISPAQFEKVTQLKSFPAFLQKDVRDGAVHTHANGEINYRVRGIHAKVSVLWNFEAPAGGGDTHYSVMRGSKANLVIRQGAEQKYLPVLSIEPVRGAGVTDAELQQALRAVQAAYPGIGVAATKGGWEVTVPAHYHNGHEAHFGQVASQFLECVETGALPGWEVPGMLAKYHATTTALDMARGG